MKLGKPEGEKGQIAAYQDGFQLQGGDQFGKCIMQPVDEPEGQVTDYSDPVINFKQDLTYGCSVSWNAEKLK